MIELLIPLGVFLLLFYAFLTHRYGYWKRLGVPYDEPTLFFGSVRGSALMRRNRAEDVDDIYTRFPGEKVVGWFNLWKPSILIRDPDLVRKVLVTDFNYFRNNDVDTEVSDDPISRNIFVLKDDEWKRSRALITPAFTSGKIKAIYPQMIQVAKDFVEYLKSHPEELHVKDTMSRYTTEIVAKCAFGIEGNAFKEDKPKIHQVGKSVFQPGIKNSLFFTILFFVPGLNKLLKLKMIPTDVSDFFDSLLKDVIVYRQNNDISRNDLIQYLIDLKRKSIEVEKGNVKSDLITRAYTDYDVLAGCVMFFIEAYETSALLLTHILYQLAMRKDIQDKLRAEIDKEMSGGDISFEQIQEMNYLNSVVQETNRLTPVAHFMFKRCTEKYDMDVGKEKPIPIEKGMSVVIPLYGLQTDPAYWEDPLEFKPERFSSKEEVQGAKAKAVFMPFGDGPRMCIGIRISTTIIKVALVYILSKLEVHTTSNTPKKMDLDPFYLMTTHKGGIRLRFSERSA